MKYAFLHISAEQDVELERCGASEICKLGKNKPDFSLLEQGLGRCRLLSLPHSRRAAGESLLQQP
jgi:hypothetical protein